MAIEKSRVDDRQFADNSIFLYDDTGDLVISIGGIELTEAVDDDTADLWMDVGIPKDMIKK